MDLLRFLLNLFENGGGEKVFDIVSDLKNGNVLDLLKNIDVEKIIPVISKFTQENSPSAKSERALEPIYNIADSIIIDNLNGYLGKD